jgi:Cu-Zn family superoxide dismutase
MTLIIGIAYFDHKKIKGTIHFYEQTNNKILIDIDLKGFNKNSTHAIHIHEAGDLTESCISACAHLNPYHKNHGGPYSKERHVGDLGNITSDVHGNVKYKFEDTMIKLRGMKCNILGRAFVIHENEDCLGVGGFEDSLTTGHAGGRICCSVIGYSKKMFT